MATLVRFGWPEASPGAKGMKNRLRVSISALRKRGLAGVLETAPDGYMLNALVSL